MKKIIFLLLAFGLLHGSIHLKRMASTAPQPNMWTKARPILSYLGIGFGIVNLSTLWYCHNKEQKILKKKQKKEARHLQGLATIRTTLGGYKFPVNWDNSYDKQKKVAVRQLNEAIGQLDCDQAAKEELYYGVGYILENDNMPIAKKIAANEALPLHARPSHDKAIKFHSEFRKLTDQDLKEKKEKQESKNDLKKAAGIGILALSAGLYGILGKR